METPPRSKTGIEPASQTLHPLPAYEMEGGTVPTTSSICGGLPVHTFLPQGSHCAHLASPFIRGCTCIHSSPLRSRILSYD